MKLIKRGIPPVDRIWRGTCTQCGSIFEAKRSEIKIENHRNESFGQAICTVCKSSFSLYLVEEYRGSQGM